MANAKQYTYQIKGNKLSLLEVDINSGGDGLNYSYDNGALSGATSNFGTSGNALNISGGSSALTSPITSVTDGIELEYAYSPSYSLPPKRLDSGTADTYHAYNGWFIVDGYLTLGAAFKDFTTHASIATDSYILIEGSDRWNGLHKVKSIQDTGGSHGGVQTYTKVNQSTKYFTDTAVSWTASETIVNVSGAFDDIFSASPGTNEYIWLAGSDTAGGVNNGLLSGWSFSGSTIDTSDATLYTISLSTETLSSTTYSIDGAHPLYVYEAFREIGGASFYSGVSILEDESFELDLPVYLSKALVYYVKAKLAEDAMEIEAKEYLMREFNRMLEKHSSSNVAGRRTVLAGQNSIR